MFNKLKNKPTEVERNSLYLVKDTPGDGFDFLVSSNRGVLVPLVHKAPLGVLITNGFGEMGTNYNFSDGRLGTSIASPGRFPFILGKNNAPGFPLKSTMETDEPLWLDPGNYVVSFWAKNISGNSRLEFTMPQYDRDGNLVSEANFYTKSFSVIPGMGKGVYNFTKVRDYASASSIVDKVPSTAQIYILNKNYKGKDGTIYEGYSREYYYKNVPRNRLYFSNNLMRVEADLAEDAPAVKLDGSSSIGFGIYNPAVPDKSSLYNLKSIVINNAWTRFFYNITLKENAAYGFYRLKWEVMVDDTTVAIAGISLGRV